MTININISIEKRHLVIFSFIITLFGIVLITNAYNPTAIGGNPSVMGHSADELDVEFGDSVQKLQQIFNNLDSNSDGIIDNTEFATNAGYSDTTGNIEWSNINNKPSVLNNPGVLATEDWVENKDYATRAYVNSHSGGMSCTGSGWVPSSSGGGCDGRCDSWSYSIQKYCSGGKVTDIRIASRCTSCDRG